MTVIIDTNILIQENALRSNIGLLVRCLLNTSKHKVAIPEVVKLEFEYNLNKIIHEKISNIQENYNYLLSLFGELKEIILPNEEQITEFVHLIFQNTFKEYTVIPFSLKAAKASFLKTVYGLPPSSEKNQQFKDGLIWEDCKRILKYDDIKLITNDKSFYQNKEIEKGLSLQLANELKGYKKKLEINPNLSSLLEELKVNNSFEVSKLKEVILNKVQIELEKIIKLKIDEIIGAKDLNYHVFATENPSKILIEFSISVTFNANDDKSKICFSSLIKGTLFLDSKENTWSDIQYNTVECTNLDTNQINRHLYLRANSIVLGHRNELFKKSIELYTE